MYFKGDKTQNIDYIVQKIGTGKVRITKHPKIIMRMEEIIFLTYIERILIVTRQLSPTPDLFIYQTGQPRVDGNQNGTDDQKLEFVSLKKRTNTPTPAPHRPYFYPPPSFSVCKA